MKNEHDQSWDFPHTHSIRLPAQESHKHETTKLLNFTVSSTRCPAPASANSPGHGSLRAPCSACSTLRLLLTSLQHRLLLAPSLREAVRAPCATLASQLLRPAGLPCAAAWRQIKRPVPLLAPRCCCCSCAEDRGCLLLVLHLIPCTRMHKNQAAQSSCTKNRANSKPRE